MPREIITEQDIEADALASSADTATLEDHDVPVPLGLADTGTPRKKYVPNVPDGYVDRLVKYIPSEVVAVYLSLDAICRSADSTEIWIRWSVLGFALLATPLYLWRVAGVRKQVQLCVSSAAFLVWAFALGGPFIQLSWYKPIYGAVLLPAFTFVAPLLAPPKSGRRRR
jgi:hypothetical protein